MKQTENKVKIVGLLSEIDLDTGSYANANGDKIDRISGSLKIRVNQTINNENVICEVPVWMFANKYTKNGSISPAYESIERVKNEFNSIAAVGEANADLVEISVTSDAIRMNEYYTQSGQLVSYPRINASFVRKLSRDGAKDCATFTADMFIKSIAPELDKQGVETGRYKVTGVIIEYGDKADVVEFLTANENVTNSIQNYWQAGDTVHANGKLNFSSKVETIINDNGFGDPEETQRTINLSELLITGGSPTPFEGEFAYTIDEIKEALAQRQERLDYLKNRAASGASRTKTAPARQSSISDLGF